MRCRFSARRLLLLALWLCSLVTTETASAQTSRKVTKLADGVYAIEHEDNQDGFANGNTTVIIGDRQVLVVDACFLPSQARKDIDQIRQWTDKPVSFLLITHFHNDHNLGSRAYMDAFPSVTIIAHSETKTEMDRFGPGSASREERENASLQEMLRTGKTSGGRALTVAEKAQVQDYLNRRMLHMDEIRRVKFQSATLTFDHDFSIDLGNREVEIKFLGRGNTPGDAVAYLPREKILAAGDLVVYPIPYIYDGYPSEWIHTLDSLGQLDTAAIVPGHGPVLHDKAYVYLIRDLMKSAEEQLYAKLAQTGPAMFRTLDEVKDAIDLSPFRQRFAGSDKDLGAQFDDMAAHLVKAAFQEASLR